MVESGISLEDVARLEELSALIVESIRQFIRTKDELMRTTIQVQIELLLTRLKRLKSTIIEIKNQIDEVCIPKEIEFIEDMTGFPLKPYVGASIDSENNIQEFSWKSKNDLEEEKKEVLNKVSNSIFHQTVNQVYNFYVGLSMHLYHSPEEKSRLR